MAEGARSAFGVGVWPLGGLWLAASDHLSGLALHLGFLVGDGGCAAAGGGEKLRPQAAVACKQRGHIGPPKRNPALAGAGAKGVCRS